MSLYPSNRKYSVYRHLKPCGDVFYIGIASNKKRPFAKTGRSSFWHRTVNKYPNYEVQILTNGVSKEEACDLETLLINYYGRRDIGTGCLVNLTDGGESTFGRKMEQWQRDQMSKDRKGVYVGDKNPNYGNYWSEEDKKKMSEIKKEQYASGEVEINLEGVMKGVEERNRRWKENPELKQQMINKVSKKNNKYQYLKIDRDTKEIIEVYESRLDVLDKNPDYKTSPLLSACNGHKRSYKGFFWRYRDRETKEVLELEYKR